MGGVEGKAPAAEAGGGASLQRRLCGRRAATPPSGRAAAPACSPGSDARHAVENEEEISSLLDRHGISTKEYGTGGALHVYDLAREVAQGFCQLEADEAGALVRHVSVVEVTLIAWLPTCRLVLIDEEQILDDGRKRQRRQQQQRLHGKLKPGETTTDCAYRTMIERLNLTGPTATAVRALPTNILAPMAGGGTGEAACSSVPVEVMEAISSSYPGLRTRYSVHRVELRLAAGVRAASVREDPAVEADREALLAHLGLPMGHTFMTVEGELGQGRGGRVHLWRWTLHEMQQVDRRLSDAASEMTTTEDLVDFSEGEDDLDDNQEEMTPLEQATAADLDRLCGGVCGRKGGPPLYEAHRDVNAVLKILDGQKVSLYERGGHLETQIAHAQDRLRRVLRRFANVEGLVSVDTNQLFGANTPEKARRLSKSLVRFIRNDFMCLAQDGGGVSPKPREALGATGGSDGNESGGGASPQEQAFQSIVAEVESLRASGEDQRWILDCLQLHERTGRRSLLTMAEMIVVPHSGELGCSEHTMRRFTSAIHRKYEDNPNPFHNEAHASIVCHSTHWLAVRGRAWGGQSLGLQVATDIAALAHDVGHFGRNNLFCSNKCNELALLYNDRSILENMHAATCFQLMQGHGCNILRDCSLENRKKYREHVVDLILATDMTGHFEFLGKFRLRASTPEFCPQENAEDRRLVTRCYLKAADLGHAALPWEMHERWALRLLTEFYEQGDEERTLGLPVSPMCERSGNVAEFRESQKGFLQFVILPLFKELATVTFPEVGETCITRIEVNAEDWVKMEPSPELVAIVKGTGRPASLSPASAYSPPKSPRTKKRSSLRTSMKKEVTFEMPPPGTEECSAAKDTSPSEPTSPHE